MDDTPHRIKALTDDAAPDLLTAIKHLLADAEEAGLADSKYSGVLIEARAAIAKQEGR